MRLKEHALSLILYQLGCRTRKSGHNFSHGLQFELPGASWRNLTRWIVCVVWPAWSIEPLKGEAQNAALSTARHTIGGSRTLGDCMHELRHFPVVPSQPFGSIHLYTSFRDNLPTTGHHTKF